MINIDRARSIRGWMSDGELLWLAGQADRSDLIIEVGTFVGRSARAMADHCNGILYCVDSYDPTIPGLVRQPGGPILKTKEDGEGIYREAQKNLDDLVAIGKLVLLKMTSIDGFEWLMSTIGCDEFDFVFIDGDHSYEVVSYDIEMYSQLVKPGGWVIGHDYYEDGVTHPGVKRAVDERVFEKLNGSLWRIEV